MELTFLGTGTSNGIPVIGCRCDVCRSDDPRDRRLRSSALVRAHGQTILIDTSPELRLQALANNISSIDAVVYTHAHADHMAGFDDLRSFNYVRQARIPVYADAFTADLMRQRYAYAFEAPFPFFGGKPDLDVHVVDGPFSIGGMCVTPIPVGHGRWTVYGFRLGGLVYVTDAKVIPRSSLDLMRDAEVLVINALREKPHPVHLSLPEALEVIREVRPQRAYLTHMSHELGHAETHALLPDGVAPAYDGLTVELGDPNVVSDSSSIA